MPTAAIAVAHLILMEHWDDGLIDKILELGDQLYAKSVFYYEDKCDPYINIDDVYTTFYINNFKVTMTYKGKRYCGLVTPEIDGQPSLADVLQDFFKEYSFGIISMKKKHLAIWKTGKLLCIILG